MKKKFHSSISILVIILLASSIVPSVSTAFAVTDGYNQYTKNYKNTLQNNSTFQTNSKFDVKPLDLTKLTPVNSGKLFDTDTLGGKLEIYVNLDFNTTVPVPQGIKITSQQGHNLVAKMTLDQLNQNSTFEALSKAQVNIPVLVLFKNHDPTNHKSLVESQGGIVKTSFYGVDAVAVKLSRHAIEKLRNDPNVASIDPDITVQTLDLGADTQVNANQVWAMGDTGQGVPVAILDTGISTFHPEFTGRIGLCHSEITNTTTCQDGNGHGTHVAGIVGASGVNPSAKGIAPSVTYFIDQVMDSTGGGTISSIIAGIDWARANNAKVISMSLGTNPLSTISSNCDNAIPALTMAINNAVSAGITVIAASGNSGTLGVGAPGCISSTIAVGAVDNTNTIAYFSSIGGPMQDHGVSAPGVSIFSSYLGGYATLSGTSMATPHVAGTIALLLKANPSITPATIKSALFSTACNSNTSPSCPTGAVSNTVYGYGRINAVAALAQVASPSSPTGLIANVFSSTQINLSWTAPANTGGSPITGYKIERESPVGGGFSVLVANTGTTTTAYSNTGLTTGTQYNYRVSAINSFVTGTPSNTAAVIPNNAVQQNNGRSAAHTPNWGTGAVSLVKFTSLTPGSSIDKVAINVFSAAGNIRYKVYQDNGVGGSASTLLAESNSIPATAGTTYNLLNIPVIVPPSGNVWVGFQPDSNAMDAYYSLTTSGAHVWDLHTFGPGPNPYVVSGSNQYEFWAGIEIIPSVSTAPGSPTGLTSTAGNAQVSLSWTSPASNGGSPITGYYINRGTTSGGEGAVPIASVGSTITTYVNTGLTNGQQYFYTVSAVNSVGPSLASIETSAKPIALLVSASPPTGTYTSPQSVLLVDSVPSTIYYTTDGSTPTTSSTNGPSPLSLTIKTNSTVKFFAKDASNNLSPVVSSTYTIIYPVITQMSDIVASSGRSTYSGRQIQSEFVSPTSLLVGKSIDTITVELKKVGSPTGSVLVGVFNADLSVKQLFGTIDSSTVNTSYKQYIFSLTLQQTYLIKSGDRIGIKYIGGDASNYVSIMTDTTNSFDGKNSYQSYYTTAWTSLTSQDLYMILKTHAY